MATQGFFFFFFFSLELRVQFCLLVCCTYPSLSNVNKEKNRTDQRASLREYTRETQHIHVYIYIYIGLYVCVEREREANQLLRSIFVTFCSKGLINAR